MKYTKKRSKGEDKRKSRLVKSRAYYKRLIENMMGGGPIQDLPDDSLREIILNVSSPKELYNLNADRDS